MTVKTISILGVRLIIVFLVFQTLGSVGVTVYSFAVQDSFSLDFIAFPVGYLITLLLLFKYADSIAELVSAGVSESPTPGTMNMIDLMTAILAGVAAYVVLSTVPTVINQLYSVLNSYWWNFEQGHLLKGRINDLFVGVIGSLIKIGIASGVFVKSRRLAIAWDNWQSPRSRSKQQIAE